MEKQFVTYMGVPTDESLWERLSKLYHPRAYDEVGGKSYLTDVSNGFLVRRLYIVFGPRGIGWGLEYDPQDIVVEPIESSSGKRRYDATALKATFWYSIYDEEGEKHSATIPSSASSDNVDRGDAIKGALSGCIKKAVSYLGHQNALYRGDLNHHNVGERWKSHGPTDPLKEAEGAQPRTKRPKKKRKKKKESKEEPVERPMVANAVREKLQDRALQYGDRTATDKQRSALPMWLAQCFPNDEESRQRHAVTDWLFGETSTKELSSGQVLAFLDWLSPNDQNQVNTYSIAEAQRMYREAQKAQGQAEMEM